MSSGLVLRGAVLADGSRADVACDADTGRITAVGPHLGGLPGDEVLELDGALLVPALAEPHAHLDKALLAERIDNPTGDLRGAIEAIHANRHVFTVPDVADRAERAARRLAANGVTAIRTHADCTADYGLTSVEGLLEARRRLAGLVDVQVCVLLGWPVSGPEGTEVRALAKDAVAMGADLVGGCPHLDDDPAAANAALLELAADLGCDLDLHTDETLDPGVLSLRDLAARVASGFPGRVTASHCCSLGVQPPEVQRTVAEEVAAAGIAVVALPQTNLYLLGRDQPAATPRGLTAVRALLAAGVTLAAGADNLQDPFNLVGRGDPLETAALMVMAAHLLPGAAFTAVTDAARAAMGLEAVRVAPGAPAELLAIDARSVREAVAWAPGARTVVHRGRLVRHRVRETGP